MADVGFGHGGWDRTTKPVNQGRVYASRTDYATAGPKLQMLNWRTYKGLFMSNTL